MKFITQVFFIISCGIIFVNSFSWQNCGSKTDTFKILSLSAFSSNSKIFYVTGEGKVARNVTAPIRAKIDMHKKFFWGWTQIPCIDQVGSCTYDDLCQFSPYLTGSCPPEYTSNNLPCRCPIPEGRYAVKRFPVNISILPDWIEEGKYRIKLNLTQNEVELLCLTMHIEFEKKIGF